MQTIEISLFFLLCGIVKTEITNFDIFPKIPNAIEYGGNELCKNQNTAYLESLRNQTLWAHKMLDSSAKDVFGILEGNNFQLGSYDECLNLIGPFPTQYCLISLTMNVSSTNTHESYSSIFNKLQKPNHNRFQRSDTLTIGLCLPASCTASDVQNSLTETIKVAGTPFEDKNVTYQVTTNGDLCSSQSNPKQFGTGATMFCVVTVILILLVLCGTAVDSMYKGNNDHTKQGLCWAKICSSFSAKRNWKNLFRTSGNEMDIFSGIKAVSIVMVVVGHKGVILVEGPWLKGEIIDNLSQFKVSAVAETLNLVVNTFFVMSGLFMSYGMMKKKENGIKFPLIAIFVRYVRLTPLVAYVSFYFTTILDLTRFGPVWNLVAKPHAEACRKNWWWNILYISNFITQFEDVCIFPTWYTSCDFQFFVTGVLLMMLIRNNRNAGYIVLTILFIVSVVTPYVIAQVYQLTPFVGLKHDYEATKFWSLYYTKPYCQGFSYIVGMFGGIAYHHIKSNGTILSKKLTYIIICISTFLIIASPGCSFNFYGEQQNSAFETALFIPLHRLFWSIGVLGICTIASFGPFVTLRSFLSSSIWIPLSKLSFGVFLIHLAIIIPGVAGTFVILRPTLFGVVTSLIGEIVLSFVAAFFMYIFVEAPALNIIKLILFERHTPFQVSTTG